MSRRTEIMAVGNSAASAEMIVGRVQSIAGAGTTTNDAAQATASNILITGGAGSSGVKLPPSLPGDGYNVKNESGQTILLYPPTGATINGAASLSMATARSVAVFFSTATACHTIPTVAS